MFKSVLKIDFSFCTEWNYKIIRHPLLQVRRIGDEVINKPFYNSFRNYLSACLHLVAIFSL